ncbi:MAG: HNH endonuclease [Pseudomonadota bacterium]|nr:HNH endonuclease [Pseudomonadota bacterium]
MTRSISKKSRFEIFKRDSFICQYCGAHPPSITLEVDHIHPVADGGGDELDNRVTACFDCNRGKGNRRINTSCRPISGLKEQAEQIAEREEQLRGYYEILAMKKQRVDREIDIVDDIYKYFVPGYRLNDKGRISVRQFIEKLDAPTVATAMENACARWSHDTDRVFKYFCGICWNIIRERGR